MPGGCVERLFLPEFQNQTLCRACVIYVVTWLVVLVVHVGICEEALRSDGFRPTRRDVPLVESSARYSIYIWYISLTSYVGTHASWSEHVTRGDARYRIWETNNDVATT